MKTIDFLRGVLTAYTKPGLEKITNGIVKRHYSKNTTLQKHRYGALRRLTGWLKAHATISAGALIATYIVIAALAWASSS